MDPTDITNNILRMLQCSWYNPTYGWTCWKDKEFRWVPKVIYLTVSTNKNADAIVINDNIDKLLGLLTRHVIYCTPDVKMRYSNIPCDKIVDKIPDNVLTLALP
jgi:hypothetical protein